MRLTDETGHRALAYVDAVSRQGYLMTVDEFKAYVKVPGRGTSSPLVKAMMATVRQSLAGLQTTVEDVAEWLERVGWLVVDDGHVRITRLGRAVLAATEEAESVADVPVDIILDPDDELSYARVIGVIMEAGSAALVDPYFRADHLFAIKQRTRVTRILIDVERLKASAVAELQQGLEDMKFDRALEVRSSPVFHDRFVIPDQGGVRLLGTSLSGVGKRFAVTTMLAAGAESEAIRRAFENAWDGAEVVGISARELRGEDEATASEAATAVAQLEGRDEATVTKSASVTRRENGGTTDP